MILELIPSKYYPIISDYAKILIPALITYFVTKYSLNRPKKYEIRLKQFEQVYLPLYLMNRKLLQNVKDKETLRLYTRKVDKIIYKNYPLVYPKTLKLFDKLKGNLSADKINYFHINNFQYQIESDYDKLKRELGYPTDSVFDFFRRLNFLDKTFYCIYVVSLCLFLYCIINSALLFFHRNYIDSLFSLLSSSVLLLLLYIIHYVRR